MFHPLRVTFYLDGTGVHYDSNEPIMLDGLLAASLCRYHVHGEPPARDETPFDIPLPLAKWHIGSEWGWKASALFPDGDQIESVQYWRKRFRQSRVEMSEGSANLSNGTYRDWNTPLPLLCIHRLVGYAVGDRRRVLRDLRGAIKYLGKKRAYGRGAVVDIEVEVIKEDWSLQRDGLSQRWLPQELGLRLVRPRPPYWNNIGRVACCEILERT